MSYYKLAANWLLSESLFVSPLKEILVDKLEFHRWHKELIWFQGGSGLSISKTRVWPMGWGYGLNNNKTKGFNNKTKGYIYSINTKFLLLKYHYIVKYKNIKLKHESIQIQVIKKI